MANGKSRITPENVGVLLEKFPIQCNKCGNQIGEKRLDSKCKCGFSNEESFTQWVFEREGIESDT